MRTVFADTFYFLALLNPRDRWHTRAVAFTTPYQGRLVTTAWVLTELGDAMVSSEDRLEFVATVDDLRINSRVYIAPADQILFDAGIKLFAERTDKQWSLTDCISFVVMQQEDITEALTGDQHFEQAGFTTLLK
jgi:uncharacterized protein